MRQDLVAVQVSRLIEHDAGRIRWRRSMAVARRRALRRPQGRTAGRLREIPRRNRSRRTRYCVDPAATTAAAARRSPPNRTADAHKFRRAKVHAAPWRIERDEQLRMLREVLQEVHPVGDGRTRRGIAADHVRYSSSSTMRCAASASRRDRNAGPLCCGCSETRPAVRCSCGVGSLSRASAWSAWVAITT